MIEDIERGRINTVLTKDMSRLGRDYIQTGHYIEKYFPENKIRYISVLDDIDTCDEKSSDDITPFKAILNDMYAKDISKKIKSVKHDKQNKGLFIGAKAPYGYVKDENDKNHLVIDECAAEIVRFIFSLAYEGKSSREIAYILNEKGVLPPAVYAGIILENESPFSKCWSAERVAYMLCNQVYIGNMVQGRVKKISYKSKKSTVLPKEQWKIVNNTHEPIIRADIFEIVQNKINQRRKTRTRKYHIVLKGKVYCKECGYRMGIIRRELKQGETFYFICRTYQRFTKMRKCTSHNIQINQVSSAVFFDLGRYFNRYSDKENLVKVCEKILDETKKKYLYYRKNVEIEKEINKIIKQMDMVYSDRLKGLIDEGDFEKHYGLLRKKKADLTEQKAKMLNFAKDFDISPKDLLDEFIITAEENHFLATGLFRRIEIDENKNIYIYYDFKKPEIFDMMI